MPPAFNLSQDQTLQFNTCFGPLLDRSYLKVNHLHDLFRLCVRYFYILKSFPHHPNLHQGDTETSQKPSTYTRRLFVLSFKEQLSEVTTGQRRGAHYRDVKTRVNSFLKYFYNISA